MKLDKNIFPFIAHTLGNDYNDRSEKQSVEAVFKSLRNRAANDVITKFVIQLSCEADGEKLKRFKKTVRFYKFGVNSKCLCYHYLVLTGVRDKCPKNHHIKKPSYELDDRFVNRFINEVLDPTLMNIRTVKKKIMRVQAEDLSSPSSHLCSSDLQRYVIAMMRTHPNEAEPIVLIDRFRTTTDLHSITLPPNLVLPNGRMTPTYPMMADLSPKARLKVLLSILRIRKSHYYRVHEYVSRTNLMSKANSRQLISLATILKAARRQALLPDVFCISLLLCAIFYLYFEKTFDKLAEDVRLRLQKFTTMKKSTEDLNVRLVHSYCQFQSVYMVFRQMNSILRFPVTELKPHICLSGIYVYNAQHLLSQAKQPLTMATKLFTDHNQAKSLFKVLYEYVTSC
ncbi:hypothetical protein HDE_14116 [Halotydeus destructor]|nr:hypothetical protein HDE_14116 [Halotydeus destructor]